MFNRKQKKMVSLEPSVPNIFETALSIREDMDITVGNFLSISKDQSFDELYELAQIARSKGLDGQVTHIGRRIIATALEQQGMSLLATRHNMYGHYDITRLHQDGRKEYIKSDGSNGEWDKKPLSTFSMQMPENVLRDIPQHIVDQADIFIPRAQDDFFVMKDPIIVVHIHQVKQVEKYIALGEDFYAGIYIWD
jgi:hypothetical protein